MIMWIMAGLVATFGALCYTEVGLLIPKSGRDLHKTLSVTNDGIVTT